MAWYAYCITEQQTLANGTRSRRPSLLDGIQGVNGAAVLAYPSGEFNIVVSEYERDNVQFGEKNVLDQPRAGRVVFRRGPGAPTGRRSCRKGGCSGRVLSCRWRWNA